MPRTFETLALAGDELHAAVEQAAGHPLTPNEAYELTETGGHFTFVNRDSRRGDPDYFAACVSGDRFVYGPDPITAAKRAYVLAAQ